MDNECPSATCMSAFVDTSISAIAIPHDRGLRISHDWSVLWRHYGLLTLAKSRKSACQSRHTPDQVLDLHC